MERANTPSTTRSRIVAVLGPTNTGKTHLAMERMLGYHSGMIGFPLRLLARENYDRAVRIKGEGAVALITGEEKIIPPRANYFLCTLESMPLSRPVAFLGIDEIQMCADPDRGYLFTERLLHARGRDETMFMGAETIRPLLRRLTPDAEIISRPRFSALTHAGPSKLSRLPPRSVIVAFNAASVYAIAELIRRERGGTAIVSGALSPRTRNAQVALYQEGEVDYLVATDAIGMGLNMMIDHVAFAATRKFDGRMQRSLTAAELAQIAGRAGRYTRDGTFGTTAEVGPLDADLIERIENHCFDPLGTIFWRSTDLSFGSLAALKASLARPSDHSALVRAREADDELALTALERDREIVQFARGCEAVRLLWEVCQIPDFGKVTSDGHSRLLAQIYRFLVGRDGGASGRLPTDWVARQVERINRTDGDIEALMQRIANIRIWTYVSHRADWLGEAAHWQQRTRAIEDSLSDALHDRLVQRFIDRRTASLYVRIRKRGDLAAAVNSAGEVLVEGHFVGVLEGFRFIPDPSVAGNSVGGAGRAVTAAALRALRSEIGARLRRLEHSEDRAFSLDTSGVISWQGAVVARLAAGPEPLRPRIEPLAGGLLEPTERERLRRRIQRWLVVHLEAELAPLFRWRTASAGGAAAGILFQVTEGLGCIRKAAVRQQLAVLEARDHRRLRAWGLRIGRLNVYFPALLKPKPLIMRALLWSVFRDRTLPFPAPGLMSVPIESDYDTSSLAALGYHRLGPRAVRVDIAERLVLHAERLARNKAMFPARMLTSLVGCTAAELPAVLGALGYRVEDGENGLRLLANPQHARSPRRQQRRRAGVRRNETASPFAPLRHLQLSG